MLERGDGFQNTTFPNENSLTAIFRRIALLGGFINIVAVFEAINQENLFLLKENRRNLGFYGIYYIYFAENHYILYYINTLR